MTKLCNEQIERARRLKKEMNWTQLGAVFGVSATTMRRKLDEDYRHRDNAKKRQQGLGWQMKLGITELNKNSITPAYCPKRDGLPEWDSVDAYLTGCPPLGRRALDGKNLGQ